MLEGKTALIFAFAEMIVYLGCCILAYIKPEIVTPFQDELSLLIDVITGFCIASIGLGASMFFQIRLYASQQKQLAHAINEARRSNDAKGIFLANMSHEIRTPINVILGMSELINRSENPKEIHEYSSVVQSSGDQLLSIINNILDITQIESGKIITSSRPYRTDSLLSELVSIGTELCGRKGLTFNAEISPDTMSMLEGDKAHLRQIVINFISNAVKYTDHGSVCLAAETIPQGDSSALFRITVSDTGIGISEKELSHIFEVFRRGKNAIETAIEGTGLGLAICRDFTESIGGKLIVKSRENEGSTFGIEVPQKISDRSPIRELSSSYDNHSTSDCFLAPECRILAIDDNTENLRVLQMLLERTMITVDTASDGNTGSEMVKKHDYDLIFLDYMMPEMDGIETFRKMKENGLTDSVPVIALTAEALSGSEEKFLKAGFTSYLSKPVSWHDLEKTLIAYLPQNKVTATGFTEDVLSDTELKKLSEILSEYDINLESGISYLSGSITRFSSLAKIFVDGYDRNHEKISDMLDRLDENLSFEVHSLKSSAKGVGALTLFGIAQELEKRLLKKDLDYVTFSKELLLFEWKRAADGMKLLIDKMPEAEENSVSETSDIKLLMQQIDKGLKEHIWLDTQNAIKQLSETETNPENVKKLSYISQFVDELDFVSAESLFRLYGESKENE